MVFSNKLFRYHDLSIGDHNAELAERARYQVVASPKPPHAVIVRNLLEDMAEKERVGLTFNRSVTESMKDRWGALEDLNVKFLQDVISMEDAVRDEMTKIERQVQSYAANRAQVISLISKSEQLAGFAMHLSFYKTMLEEKLKSMSKANQFLQRCTEVMGFQKPAELMDRHYALEGIFEEIFCEFEQRSVNLTKLQEYHNAIVERALNNNIVQYNEMADKYEEFMTLKNKNTDTERFIQSKLELSTSTALIVYRIQMAVTQIYMRLMERKGEEPTESDPMVQLEEINSNLQTISSIVDVVRDMMMSGYNRRSEPRSRTGRSGGSGGRRKFRRPATKDSDSLFIWRSPTSYFSDSSVNDDGPGDDPFSFLGAPKPDPGRLRPPEGSAFQGSNKASPAEEKSKRASPRDGKFLGSNRASPRGGSKTSMWSQTSIRSQSSLTASIGGARYGSTQSIRRREHERVVREALLKFSDVGGDDEARIFGGRIKKDMGSNRASISASKMSFISDRSAEMSENQDTSPPVEGDQAQETAENAEKGDVNVNRPAENVERGDVNVNRPAENAEKGDVNVNRPADSTGKATIKTKTCPVSSVPVPRRQRKVIRVGGPSSGRRVQATPPRDMSDNRRSKVANTNRPLCKTVSGSSMEVNRIPPSPETVGKSRGAATRWARSNGTRDPTKTRRPVADITERGSRLPCIYGAQSQRSLEAISGRVKCRQISGARRGDGSAGVNLPSIQRGGESNPWYERYQDRKHSRGQSVPDDVMAEADAKMTSQTDNGDDRATSVGLETPPRDASPERSRREFLTDVVRATHEIDKAEDSHLKTSNGSECDPQTETTSIRADACCASAYHDYGGVRSANTPSDDGGVRLADTPSDDGIVSQPWRSVVSRSPGDCMLDTDAHTQTSLPPVGEPSHQLPLGLPRRLQGRTRPITKPLSGATIRRSASPKQGPVQAATARRRDVTSNSTLTARKASGVADAKCAGPSKQQSWVAGPRGFLPSVPPRPKHAAPVTLGKTRALAPATGNMPTTTSASSGKSHKPAVLKSGVSESVGPKSKNIRSLVSRSNLPATSPGRVELGSRSSAGQASTLESRRVLSQVCQSRRYLRANCLSILAGVNLRSRGSAPSMDIPPGQGQESDMLKCLNHSTPRT